MAKLKVVVLGLVAIVASVWLLSWSGNESEMGPVDLPDELDERNNEKMKEVSALFHLAGGKKVLSEKAPTFGDKSLEQKNEDALNILSKFFSQNHPKNGPKDDSKTGETNRGRVQNEDSKATSHDAHPHEPLQHENSGGPAQSQAEDMEETPNEALQGLIAGWSGAGWWQPCAEVCRPQIGTKHTKANFQIFTACEHKCRQTKTRKLKEVMSHISTDAEAAAKRSPKEIAPRTIQKLSKHLIKWAESNGLPSKLGADANSNLVDNEKVGESITGMLIAGWSGAGWWKPCADVCRPQRGTKRTKANFDIFMECESTCRKNKAEYLQAFISPKDVVKALAHAKTASNATALVAKSAQARIAHAAKSAAPQAQPHIAAASATPNKAQAAHSASITVTPSESKQESKVSKAPAAQSTQKPSSPPPKHESLIEWAEAHGLPKAMVNNPADKTKVKDIIARMKADRAVEKIKEQMAQDTEKVTDVVRGADPTADTKSWLNT